VKGCSQRSTGHPATVKKLQRSTWRCSRSLARRELAVLLCVVSRGGTESPASSSTQAAFRAAFFALSHTTMAVASELRCNAYPSTNSKAHTFAPRRTPLRRAPLHRRCYLTTVAIRGAEPSAALCEGATICPDAKTNPNTTIHAIRIVAKAIAKGPRFRSSRVSRSYGRGRCGFRDIA
jgi:hypothetical protein